MADKPLPPGCYTAQIRGVKITKSGHVVVEYANVQPDPRPFKPLGQMKRVPSKKKKEEK